jgi:hypothetical protein
MRQLTQLAQRQAWQRLINCNAMTALWVDGAGKWIGVLSQRHKTSLPGKWRYYWRQARRATAVPVR